MSTGPRRIFPTIASGTGARTATKAVTIRTMLTKPAIGTGENLSPTSAAAVPATSPTSPAHREPGIVSRLDPDTAVLLAIGCNPLADGTSHEAANVLGDLINLVARGLQVSEERVPLIHQALRLRDVDRDV